MKVFAWLTDALAIMVVGLFLWAVFSAPLIGLFFLFLAVTK